MEIVDLNKISDSYFSLNWKKTHYYICVRTHIILKLSAVKNNSTTDNNNYNLQLNILLARTEASRKFTQIVCPIPPPS